MKKNISLILPFLIKRFVPFLLVGLFGRSNAQTLIKGQVTDAKTNKPILGVNILVDETSIGTTSDSLGNFSFETPSYPLKLIVSHVSYESEKVLLDEMPLKSFSIQLQPRLISLSSISIISDGIQLLLDTSSLNIIDYQLFENKLLLLAHSYSQSEYFLLLTDYRGNVLVRQKIPLKPQKIVKDCLNNYHLIGKDQSFEIQISESQFFLNNPVKTSTFDAIIPRCLAELNNRYYIHQYRSQKQELYYYYIEDEKEGAKKIKEIIDEFSLRMAKDEARFARMGGIKYDEFDARFANEFIFKPIFAPLLKFDNKMLLFDFVNNRMEHLSNEHQIEKTVPLHFHKTKGWEKELLVDEESNKIYAHHKVNGISNLSEINIQTGLLQKSTSLKNFPFIESIKIHDNVVYFLSKTGKNAVRMIYFMNIK